MKRNRKPMRLKDYNYSSNGAYFITICVKNRECVFGEIINSEIHLSEMGKLAYKNWLDLVNNFDNIEIDEFIVMPNHIHGIIFISESSEVILELDTKDNSIYKNTSLNLENNSLLGKVIRYYKAKTTSNIRKEINQSFQWQRNYHEWIIKNPKMFGNVQNYIINNPIKWETDRENPQNPLTPI